MHQLMAYLNTGFTGAFSPLWAALEMNPPNPPLQAALREWGREAVIDRHDKLEGLIGDTPFLVGDRPTLADAVLVGVARWLDIHDVADPERWPRLVRVRRHIEADVGVIFATGIENGRTPAGSAAWLGHVPLRDVIEQFGR
jgi:glutathione S-transferase